MRIKIILSCLVLLLVGCARKSSHPADSYFPTLTPTSTHQPTTPSMTASVIALATETPAPTKTLVTPTPIWDDKVLIAYIKDTNDPNYQNDNSVYIVDSKGQNQVNVFAGITGIRGLDLSWSPSGRWLLFSEYEKTTKPTDLISRSFNLWAVRADGTNRRKLIPINQWNSINWAQTQDIFLLNCDVRDGETEICIVNPETGVVIRTGHVGSKPQFSPDNKSYAYLENNNIYLVNSSNQNGQRLFSTVGKISGYAWTKDQTSIITAVVNQPGCGNDQDGSSTIIEISITTKEFKVLREIKWSIYKLDLSPDQNYILSSWFLCTGNAYELDGVIGIQDNLVAWPFNRFVDYQWNSDGKFIIGEDISGSHSLIDPLTGNYPGEINPPVLNSLLTDQERKSNVGIFWVAQPAR